MTKPSLTIAFRVDEVERAQLDQLCAMDRRSISTLMSEALEDYFVKRGYPRHDSGRRGGVRHVEGTGVKVGSPLVQGQLAGDLRASFTRYLERGLSFDMARSNVEIERQQYASRGLYFDGDFDAMLADAHAAHVAAGGRGPGYRLV